MNQQLAPFDFEGRQVRIMKDAQGEPWFVAADVLSTIISAIEFGIGLGLAAMLRKNKESPDA